MTVSPSEIERIARLASISISTASLDTLAEQVGNILDYVAQLDAEDASPASPLITSEPDTTSMRPDVEDAIALERSLEDTAPEFTDGFFVVPRVSGVGDEP